jgi:methylphosphotriester-DNA--protein-cysteine methyltransferase
LYRAADSTGSTVEFFMSAYRDLEAAKSLFRRGLRNGAHPQGCRYHAHHHFRGLTGMTPPQYQKQIQLQAARARMLADDVDAATVAFEVGYESPSQFNPEYSRLFGEPPIPDRVIHPAINSPASSAAVLCLPVHVLPRRPLRFVHGD